VTRGRPALRVGQHGSITRREVSPGVWKATTYFRGPDGKRREVQKRTPRGVTDRYGAAAVEALVKRLDELNAMGQADADATVTSRTLVSTLLDRHLDVLRAAERAPRTLYSYELRVRYWNEVAGGITVADCTAGRLARLVELVEKAHGKTDAKQLRFLLAAALDMAVADGVFTTNPARAMKPPPKPKTPKGRGAKPINPDLLPKVVEALTGSQKCQDKDLTDPILMHLATGLRVSEVLGFLWEEFDPVAKTITVSGRVVWAKGEGLLRTPTFDSAKGTAPVIALAGLAVDMLVARAQQERLNLCGVIFPSSVGKLRDPSGFARQWREVRGELGKELEASTGHSFRKMLGDLVSDTTGDMRKTADVLGHRDIQTTIKHYLSRGKPHPEVAAMVDDALRGKRSRPKHNNPRVP